MRFAPPKSAPTETRRSTKYAVKEEESDLSGWVIKHDITQPDITLLRQSLNTGPRRCSSATERRSGGHLIVQFNKRGVSSSLQRASSEGSIKSRTDSKDSGVSGLTEGSTDTMITEGATAALDNRGKIEDYDDDEFSDISESNDDGSLDNEAELAGLSEPEFNEFESRDPQSPPVHHGELVKQEVSQFTGTSNTENNNTDTSNTGTRNTNKTDRKSRSSRNKVQCRAKREVEREHQMPHPVTPEIPENGVSSTQNQVWSRSRKLERHSTSPSLCSYSDVCSQVYDVKKDPEQFLHNPFDNVLHANRPPYRNEKRRGSFKSSCSIPSFSTPSQALLLIGMKPVNKPTVPTADSNKNAGKPPHRKLYQKPPPVTNKTQARVNCHVSSKNYIQDSRNVLELPALTVNGAGDLVIRKKQIISG